MELCLGTVQLGMNYGVQGHSMPAQEESFQILDRAVACGINHFDTANAYGVAEELLGQYFAKRGALRNNVCIVSKTPPDFLENCAPEKYRELLRNSLQASLARLGTDYLDAYLLHTSRYIFNDEILDVLSGLKKEGLIRNAGVSIYESREALRGIESPLVDFLQVPYSILDQRMLRDGVFHAQERESLTHTTIHARSVFVQGLILMNQDDIPPHLSAAKPIVSRLSRLCEENGISRISLALGFVKRQSVISHIVFGVDSIAHLNEYVLAFEEQIEDEIINTIAAEFANVPLEIAMPNLWAK